jgi:hypothetical protein
MKRWFRDNDCWTVDLAIVACFGPLVFIAIGLAS